MPFDSAPLYGERPGEREKQLKKIKETIDSWSDISDDLKTEFKKRSEDFLDDHTYKTTAKFYGGQIGFRSWIIKNDDLKLLEQLIPAATTIITFLSVANTPVAVMVAGLAFSGIGIAKKLKTKGVDVDDPADFHVLMTLKEA